MYNAAKDALKELRKYESNGGSFTSHVTVLAVVAIVTALLAIVVELGKVRHNLP